METVQIPGRGLVGDLDMETQIPAKSLIKRVLEQYRAQQQAAADLAGLFGALEQYWARRFVDGANLPGLVAGVLADVPILLIGPPGTAKTMQAMELASVLGVDFVFSQLHPFLTPEALFGLLNPAALAQGRVEIITEGYATQRRPFVWLIDEVSRAGPAVAALLLSAINERRVRYYGPEFRLRAVAIIGTTNFMPEEEEVRAFLDRFAVRLFYNYVGDKAALIKAAFADNAERPRIPLSLLERLRAEVEARARAAAASAEKYIIRDVVHAVENAGASDRRLVQAWRVAAALSVYYGEPEVTPLDLVDALVYTLPSNVAERDRLRAELLQTELGRDFRELSSAVMTVENLAQKVKSGEALSDSDRSALSEAAKKVKMYATKLGRRALGELEKIRNVLQEAKIEEGAG
jgi:MoxR-like ATPase